MLDPSLTHSGCDTGEPENISFNDFGVSLISMVDDDGQKRRFYKATEFSPHPDDEHGFQELSEVYVKFALTPRGRIYAVVGRLNDRYARQSLDNRKLEALEAYATW